MNRLLTVRSKMTQYPYIKSAKRLKSNELRIIEDFIVKNDHLDYNSFELAVNRMFIDKEKPKNFLIILELLTVANSALRNY